MKKHTQIYMKAMKYDIHDFIPCEICDNKAVDIHHIEARGMGGTKEKDVIENLMALCRECHVEFGDITECKPYLQKIHEIKMNINGVV